MEKSLDIRKKAFIDKALELFGDEKLDYSKVDYVNNRTKVCIIDHDIDENGVEYGEFYVTPSNFMKGRRHPGKRGKRISENKRMGSDEVIERFKSVHNGENLDYSKVEYVNMHTKVCIIDPEYGEYWQEPSVHLKGCGHPMRNRQRDTLSTEEFITKAKNVHGDRYDYSKTNYVNYRAEVCITCKKHGDFYQTAENHLYGKGCPKCGKHYSKFEDEITKLIECDYITHDRTILNGFELDIYIPNKKIAIEFNGLKWHSEWFGGKDKNYHLSKTVECENKGIKLIQIFEDEYRLHKNIVDAKIKHIIHECDNLPKIYARKCNISLIGMKSAKEFLNMHHIQGFTRSSIYLGAFYFGLLVGVMSFKKENKNSNNWELTRFATKIDCNCIGVGGKLFSWFVKNYKPELVKSFADRRWSTGLHDNLYNKLGFEFDSYTKPDYRYININKQTERKHKFGFRKSILSKKYNLPISMTETEMVKKLGYDRIWDCGLIKYIWRRQD